MLLICNTETKAICTHHTIPLYHFSVKAHRNDLMKIAHTQLAQQQNLKATFRKLLKETFV